MNSKFKLTLLVTLTFLISDIAMASNKEKCLGACAAGHENCFKACEVFKKEDPHYNLCMTSCAQGGVACNDGCNDKFTD